MTETAERSGVVVVAPASDQHADVVQQRLSDAGVPALRLDLGSVLSRDVCVRPGRTIRAGDIMVTPSWTVWWRRADHPRPLPDLSLGESALASDEALAIVVGGLSSLGVRWVDEPFTMLRAEQRLYQLAIADRLGISTPPTLATNDSAAAGAFARSGPTIAKSISSGVQPGPYADSIQPGDTALVVSAPTMLQRRIDATHDIRAVVVGEAAYMWSRRRAGGDPVDWRAVDPGGGDFAYVPRPNIKMARQAVTLNKSLDLTVSVQDWLMRDGTSPVLLEVNPAGAWLFLDGAESIVADALATHLSPQPASAGLEQPLQHRLWRSALRRLDADPDGPTRSSGRWPTTRQGFLWDLAPASIAPPSDGVIAPAGKVEPWLEALAGESADEAQIAALVDAERRRHMQARDAAATAEAKASRLLTPIVALLVGVVALVAFQVASAGRATTTPGMLVLLALTVPGTAGVAYLITGIVRSLDADTRVGVYGVVRAVDHISRDKLALLRAEHLAARTARWTATQKASQLMFARAAVSRAFALLVIALVLAAVTTLATHWSERADGGTQPEPTPPSPRATTSATSVPTPVPTTRRPLPQPSRPTRTP
jgi:hypothetical protein